MGLHGVLPTFEMVRQPVSTFVVGCLILNFQRPGVSHTPELASRSRTFVDFRGGKDVSHRPA